MVTRRVNDPNAGEPRRRRAARSPEARENQLIQQAVDLAEQQIANGTVSAQVLSHYLKLASSREKLEQEMLAEKVELLKIQRESIASQQRVEELYKEAMAAFKSYSPHTSDQGMEEDYYED